MLQKQQGGTKNRKHIFFIAVCAFLISSFTFWLIHGSSNAFTRKVGDLIRKELIRVDPQPFTKIVDAIYVLGGSQSSLEFKFKVAAELYHRGIAKKILILSRPGKTEFSLSLGRNLTNDEWAILKLEKLGVPKKNFEPISIKKSFFGTKTEAKNVSKLIIERGFKSVVLISSAHHTHRVRISFEKFLKDRSVTLYVQVSGERVSLRKLIIEFIKLKIYEYFLVS